MSDDNYFPYPGSPMRYGSDTPPRPGSPMRYRYGSDTPPRPGSPSYNPTSPAYSTYDSDEDTAPYRASAGASSHGGGAASSSSGGGTASSSSSSSTEAEAASSSSSGGDGAAESTEEIRQFPELRASYLICAPATRINCGGSALMKCYTNEAADGMAKCPICLQVREN